MSAAIPEPGPSAEQPPGGIAGPAGGGQAGFAGGWSADLDYHALQRGLAACGLLDGTGKDAQANFARWLAVLACPDQAPVAAVAVEHMPPGPPQAAWLEVAAAGVGRLDENALTGVAIAARQQAAHAQAIELAAVGKLTARTAEADRRIGLEADGRPARISRDAVGQIEMALKLTHYSAQERADLAVALVWRLPATLAAMRAGTIDYYRAQLIAGATSVLSEGLARAVEAQILPGAGQMTAARLREKLHYAVIAADPEGAERRREEAERNAEMRLYADDDQTATLLLTKLPQVEAAAVFARVTALARARIAAGMPGTLNFHRVQVAMGLLNETLPLIPPAEGASPDQPPPDDDHDPGGPGDEPGPGHGGPGDSGDRGCPGGRDPSHGSGDSPGDGGHGDGQPAGGGPGDERPAPRDEDVPADDGLGDDGLGGDGASPAEDNDRDPAECREFADNGVWDDLPAPWDEDAPAEDGLDDRTEDEGYWDPAEVDEDPYGTGPVPDWPALGAVPPALRRRPGGPADGRPAPALLDSLVPWATLAGLADRPGTLGRIGAITAAQARQLAAAAEHDPAAQWRVIVTNGAGQAITVARIRRPRHRRRDGPGRSPPPPGAGLVGRITVTITEDTVTGVTGGRQEASGCGPSSGIAAAALRTAVRALDRARARAEADASAGGCAHAGQSPAYRPPPRLREQVTARDVTCRNPVCGQPAWRADLDHTRPYDQHGRTCRCNLGGACRRDHGLKQHPRWKLEQIRPGVFRWTAPSGRTYGVEPDTHPM
jgi:hypothetical protein